MNSSGARTGHDEGAGPADDAIDCKLFVQVVDVEVARGGLSMIGSPVDGHAARDCPIPRHR